MESFAAPDNQDTWQVGQIILNSYEVESILGKGGMGQVYHITASSRVGVVERGQGMAVKRPLPTIFTRTGGKEDFEREAETWVKLEKHRHIVECYFVRTLAGVPCIFIEYMAGGSLKDWIVGEESALYREGPTGALARILDLAIQMAWGLDYAHKQGLVHRDFKPANVLLTPQGIAKITDFGLARARFLAGEGTTSAQPGASTVKLDVGLMTLEYASPEQVAGQPLTHHTDLWSWAVSMLDLFVGDVDRGFGPASAEALENSLREEQGDPVLPQMPPAVATLLRQCFQSDPAARPASMGEVATSLQMCYAEVVGAPYLRPVPQSADASAYDLYYQARSLAEIGKLEETLDVCEQLLRLEPREAHNWTLKGHTLSGLQRYEEALAALEQALRLNPQHVDTWMGKGNTLHCLKQIQEALEAYEQALRLNPQSADAWMGKGDVLSDLQRYEEALTALEQALRLYKQPLPPFLKEADYAGEAEVLARMGMVYSKRAQLEQALRCFEQALPLYREKKNHAAEAHTLTNMGAMRRQLGQPEEALRHYEQALSLRRKVGDRAGEAITLNNMGLVYSKRGQFEQALRHYEQALSLRREVGDRRGEATTLNNIAAIHHLFLDQPAEALRCFEQALPLWREVGDRAQEVITLSKIGEAYRALGQLERALRCFEQELRTTQEIKDRAGETDALNKIGSIYQLRGQFDAASRYFKQAIDRNVASEPHHATPLAHILVFREGPLPPDGAYIQKVLEHLIPDALTTPGIKITAYPVRSWLDDMADLIYAILAQLEGDDALPPETLGRAILVPFRDTSGTRGYLVKVPQPSPERARPTGNEMKMAEKQGKGAPASMLAGEGTTKAKQDFLERLIDRCKRTSGLLTRRWWQFRKINLGDRNHEKGGGDPRVSDLLLTVLQDKEFFRRSQAAQEMAKIANSRAVAPLLAALQEQDSFVRKVAAETLGKIGDPRAVAPLVALLKDKDPYVREQAAKALGEIGDRRAVVPLIGVLSASDGFLVGAAAVVLGKFGDARAVAPLLTTLATAAPHAWRDSSQSRAACGAAEALGSLGDPRAIVPLVDELSNRNISLRKAALLALAKLDLSHALERWTLALSASEETLRTAAVHALQEAQPSWDAHTISSLLSLLESGTPYAAAAAEVLARHDSPEIRRALTVYHNRQASYRSQLAQQPLDDLIAELIRIGQKPGYLRDKGDLTEFDSGDNVRARDIGAELDRRGGIKLMRTAHAQVVAMLGHEEGEMLEYYVWDGVGDWIG